MGKMIPKFYDVIKNTLIKHEKAQDSDYHLYYHICIDYYGCNLDNITGSELFKRQMEGELPNFESIGRIRRLVFADHPDLRGDTYEGRKEKADEIKEEILHHNDLGQIGLNL